MDKVRQLFVSFGSLNAFSKCPRYYWYKHIRRLELVKFNIAFTIGRIMHHGIQVLFESPKKAEEEIKKKFKEEAQNARKQFPQMGIDDEQELAQQEFISVGMLRAFRAYYSKFLKETTHISTEFSIKYQLNPQVTVVGKIDNIIANFKKLYIYELKNLKSFDMSRIQSIKTDPQTSLYFELYNRMAKKADRLNGIIYKIIKKPQIRQKQSESKGEFLRRLEGWYEDRGETKFHLERLNAPFISGEAVLNSVDKVSKRMLANGFSKEEYYQDFSYCVHDWGLCQFYGLCHEGGETPANMKLYKIRPKFKVQEEGGAEKDG